MRIRRLEPGDADRLQAFYNGLSARSKRLFCPLGETTTVEACRAIGRDNECDQKFDLVALHEGEIAGWGFVWALASEQPTFGLCVADRYQGQGIGGCLMDRVLEAARGYALPEIHLTVVQDNRVAQRLYQGRGFVRCGELVGSDGLDYYRMMLRL
jgi:ribosomal protein S18 acetylase RimI-like enzyme